MSRNKIYFCIMYILIINYASNKVNLQYFLFIYNPHACKTSRNIQRFEDDVVEQRKKETVPNSIYAVIMRPSWSWTYNSWIYNFM
jgi:hypothetical protein